VTRLIKMFTDVIGASIHTQSPGSGFGVPSSHCLPKPDEYSEVFNRIGRPRFETGNLPVLRYNIRASQKVVPVHRGPGKTSEFCCLSVHLAVALFKLGGRKQWRTLCCNSCGRDLVCEYSPLRRVDRPTNA
jgi:hypothetical protein